MRERHALLAQQGRKGGAVPLQQALDAAGRQLEAAAQPVEVELGIVEIAVHLEADHDEQFAPPVVGRRRRLVALDRLEKPFGDTRQHRYLQRTGPLEPRAKLTACGAEQIVEPVSLQGLRVGEFPRR